MVNLSLAMNLNSFKVRQFKVALLLLLLGKDREEKFTKDYLHQAFLPAEEFLVSVEKRFSLLEILG